MKIGVISDTHIRDRIESLPQQLLAALKGMDMIIHVGDLVDITVLEQLNSICKNIKAVCGNMDPVEVRKRLPEKEIFSIGNFRIGLMHGYGPPDKLVHILKTVFKNERLDVIIFGHSHEAMNEFIDGILFFNPGSPTDKMFARYNSYGLIEINNAIKAQIIKL